MRLLNALKRGFQWWWRVSYVDFGTVDWKDEHSDSTYSK